MLPVFEFLQKVSSNSALELETQEPFQLKQQSANRSSATWVNCLND